MSSRLVFIARASQVVIFLHRVYLEHLHQSLSRKIFKHDIFSLNDNHFLRFWDILRQEDTVQQITNFNGKQIRNGECASFAPSYIDAYLNSDFKSLSFTEQFVLRILTMVIDIETLDNTRNYCK